MEALLPWPDGIALPGGQNEVSTMSSSFARLPVGSAVE